MKHEVKVGQQDYTVLILIRDTAGAPKTALTFESAGLDVCYTRVETDNDVVLADGAPVTTTLTGAHVDWGFVLVDNTKAPGLYKLDIADEVFASGAWSAVVSVVCTGCDPVHIEFVLVPEAPYSGVKVSTTGLTAIADAVLDRDFADAETALTSLNDRSLLQAARFLRNKWALSGTTLSVKKEDDSTEAWSATVTATEGADPITAVDPA